MPRTGLSRSKKCLSLLYPYDSGAAAHGVIDGVIGGGAIADEITRANPMITEAITIAIARFPFFNSSHSSTGVSHVKIPSRIQRETAIVKMPTAPHPISFR